MRKKKKIFFFLKSAKENFKKGELLSKEKRVKMIQIDENNIRTIVTSSNIFYNSISNFNVTITFKEGNLIKISCDCFNNKGKISKLFILTFF